MAASADAMRLSMSLLEDGVGFDFDEPFRRNEFADLHHAGSGADRAEEFAVRAADFLPFGDVGDVNARADDVFEARAGFGQGGFDEASPTPTMRPSGPDAVVPETVMVFPMRRARKWPTIGSHGAPLQMF